MVLSVKVSVVEIDTVTDLAVGVIVTVDVSMNRAFVTMCVDVAVLVVVLQTDTVFGEGLGHTRSQAGQIRCVA